MQVLRQLVGTGEPLVDGSGKVRDDPDICFSRRHDEIVFADGVEKEDASVQRPARRRA